MIAEAMLYLDLGLISSFHFSDRLTWFTSLLDCQSFLIITTVLLFLDDGLVVAYRLATANMNTDRNEVGCLIVIIALTNLCAAGIIYNAPGFNSSAFPGMQVVRAFGVGSRAFCRLVLEVLLHLDLALFPSIQISCFTTPGSSFIFDSEFLLIIIGLLFINGIVAAYGLATADVVNKDPGGRISVGLTQM
jgi:hypothetical protein